MDHCTFIGTAVHYFFSFGYYEYIGEQIRGIKLTLAVEDGDPEHDSKENMQGETKFRIWLINRLLGYHQPKYLFALRNRPIS